MLPKREGLFKQRVWLTAATTPLDSRPSVKTRSQSDGFLDMSNTSWLTAAGPALDGCTARGALLVLTDASGTELEATLRESADERELEFACVDAATLGLTPARVLQAGVTSFLGNDSAAAHPEAGNLIRSALGDGAGATSAWERLCARWAGNSSEGPGSASPGARPWLAESEVLGRILQGIGEVEPRLLLVRSANLLDEASARALQALLGGGPAAGWACVVDGPSRAPSPCQRLTTALQRIADDERFDCVRYVELEAPAATPKKRPAPPESEGADELLTILSAARLPLPAAVVGSTALANYRGRSRRSGWVALDALLSSGHAEVCDALLTISGATRTGSDEDQDVAQVVAADCRALVEAVEEVLGEFAPLRLPLCAALAARGGATDSHALALDAGRAALQRGDVLTASTLLDRSIQGASEAEDAELALLRSRARRAAGDPEGALRSAERGLDRCAEGNPQAAALWNEVGRAAELLDQGTKAAASFASAVEAISGESNPLDAAHAHAGRARQLADADDFVAAAAAYGDEARTLEQNGLHHAAARSLANRALCMAQAGATDQAIKELQRAAERLSDGQSPDAEVLEARMLMGRVFRFAGKREQAKKALAMSADTAHQHAAADIEGQARLGLARLFLEGMPAQGPGRGEALRDGRAAAEATVAVARGLGDHALEAAAEGILGELSYRSEDWEGALQSLARQEVLWQCIGRIGDQVDVALRRSRVATRCDRWQDGLEAANSALNLASRRRLHELAAQAQLLRGESLQELDKGSEALAAFSEAERLYSSLGPSFRNQAEAASERARQAVG